VLDPDHVGEAGEQVGHGGSVYTLDLTPCLRARIGRACT
jgi:hypothetical protein